MKTQPDGRTIRQTFLTVIEEYSRKPPHQLIRQDVLGEAARRLQIRRWSSPAIGRPRADLQAEQALLTMWHDLFLQGLLAPGYDLSIPQLPYCHLTKAGREMLQHLSRDPANPDGYLADLRGRCQLHPVSDSYIEEAVRCYNAGLIKAAAVMVGAAAESLALELRNAIVSRMNTAELAVPADLQNWRLKPVLSAIHRELDQRRESMPKSLAEAFDAYWTSFTQQIRVARNDAGHPKTVDPVTHDDVHASLLIFPHLAQLCQQLKDWVGDHLV